MSDQPQLFNPDFEPVRYIAENGTFEFTLDGAFKTFWLTQKQIAELFNLDISVVSRHIQTFKEELSVIARDANTETAAPTNQKFRLVASDGKSYEVEHYNHEVVIDVGYRAKSTTETIKFRRFVAEVFRQRFEDEHKRAMQSAFKARSQKITGYILDGLTPAHAERRVDIGDVFKELASIIARISGPKLIGAAVNQEYLTLFGKLGSQLKEILETKNIRDSLPDLQLQYIQLAETALIMVLKQQARLSTDELLQAVIDTVKPLGDHLKAICRVAGIDLITGESLLGEGHKPRVIQPRLQSGKY